MLKLQIHSFVSLFQSIQSSLDNEVVDLSGLHESVVDSDEEELADSMEVRNRTIHIFTSRESQGILVTPSHGLFVTIYTELTRMSRCVRKFPCRFSSVLRNFPFNLSSCTKGSMLIFVVRFDFLRDVYETFRDIFHAVHKIF